MRERERERERERRGEGADNEGKRDLSVEGGGGDVGAIRQGG